MAEGYTQAIEDIKRKVVLSDLIGLDVNLKRVSNGHFVGLCPFHKERTASFHVFDAEPSHYHCFGCNERGDALDYVQHTKTSDFLEALRFLADRYGIELPTFGKKTIEEVKLEKDKRKQLLKALRAAADYFQDQLLNTLEGLQVIEYLEKRGIKPPTIYEFKVGYVPLYTGSFLDAMKEKGFTVSDLCEAGLGKMIDGSFYQYYRGRVVLPITNPMGDVISFTGRQLDFLHQYKDGSPKYFNGPTIEGLYQKSKILFGLYQAKEAIRKTETAIVVEGAFDVVVLHHFGYKNVVAPLGTAFNPEHLRAIGSRADCFILALDGDSAGEAATESILDRLREHIRLEQSEEIDLRVVQMPEGKDPDEVVQEGMLETLLENAIPVVEFYLDRVRQSCDLSTAHGKQEAVEKMLPIISEVKDSVQVTHYLQVLATLVGVPVDVVRQKYRNRGRYEKPAKPVPPPSPLLGSQEDRFLAEFIRYFNPLFFKVVTAKDNKPVTGLDFNNSKNRFLFEALKSYQSLDDPAQLEAVVASQHDLMVHIRQLVELGKKAPEIKEHNKIVYALRSRLNLIRQEQARNELQRITGKMKQEDTPELLEEYTQAVQLLRVYQ